MQIVGFGPVKFAKNCKLVKLLRIVVMQKPKTNKNQA